MNKEMRRYLKLQELLQMQSEAFGYYELMIDCISPIVDYPALYDSGRIELETLIEYASASGVGAVCKIGDEYRCGALHWSSVPDDNGIADKCIINGAYWSDEFNTKDIAFYRFTHSQRPALHLKWFSEMFANVDNSQKSLVRNTKYTPMPVVATEAERAKYEEALARQQRGEGITVLVNPKTNPLLQQSSTPPKESDKILNIGDASMIEKMHFLSEYHAELKKRFGAIYGMCFKSSAKSAQESLDEIHGMDNFSLIIPYAMREEMRKFADKCKKLWGWAGRETVDFSELWKRENEAAADNSAPAESAEMKEGAENADR